MRARWQWAIPPGVILCLLAPILLTDRTFASDWGNHYWLIYMQGLDIKALHEPSIYLQSTLGAFYPYYAFYGGTFYAVGGLVADVSSTDVAMVLAYGGAVAGNSLRWALVGGVGGGGGGG